MSAASISQFDWRLVNQQRQINDCVFRLFDSSKYLTTLRSNISPCQKATILILIALCNPSFYLCKPSKKSLGTTVFLSWIPFKISDFDKFLSTTPVTQFWLWPVTWQTNLHFLALHTRWLIKKAKKCEKLSIFFVGMENFTFREMHLSEKSIGKS